MDMLEPGVSLFTVPPAFPL